VSVLLGSALSYVPVMKPFILLKSWSQVWPLVYVALSSIDGSGSLAAGAHSRQLSVHVELPWLPMRLAALYYQDSQTWRQGMCIGNQQPMEITPFLPEYSIIGWTLGLGLDMPTARANQLLWQLVCQCHSVINTVAETMPCACMYLNSHQSHIEEETGEPVCWPENIFVRNLDQITTDGPVLNQGLQSQLTRHLEHCSQNHLATEVTHKQGWLILLKFCKSVVHRKPVWWEVLSDSVRVSGDIWTQCLIMKDGPTDTSDSTFYKAWQNVNKITSWWPLIVILLAHGDTLPMTSFKQ